MRLCFSTQRRRDAEVTQRHFLTASASPERREAKHYQCLCSLGALESGADAEPDLSYSSPETSTSDARLARSVSLLAYTAERNSASVTRASRPAKASAARRGLFPASPLATQSLLRHFAPDVLWPSPCVFSAPLRLCLKAQPQSINDAITN